MIVIQISSIIKLLDLDERAVILITVPPMRTNTHYTSGFVLAAPAGTYAPTSYTCPAARAARRHIYSRLSRPFAASTPVSPLQYPYYVYPEHFSLRQQRRLRLSPLVFSCIASLHSCMLRLTTQATSVRARAAMKLSLPHISNGSLSIVIESSTLLVP